MIYSIVVWTIIKIWKKHIFCKSNEIPWFPNRKMIYVQIGWISPPTLRWVVEPYPSEKWWTTRTSWDDDIPFPTIPTEWKAIKVHGSSQHQPENDDCERMTWTKELATAATWPGPGLHTPSDVSKSLARNHQPKVTLINNVRFLTHHIQKHQKIIWLLTVRLTQKWSPVRLIFLLRHPKSVTSPLDLSRSACPCRIHPAYPRPLGLWDVPGRAASMRWPSFGKGDGARWDEIFIQKMWGWDEMRFTHVPLVPIFFGWDFHKGLHMEDKWDDISWDTLEHRWLQWSLHVTAYVCQEHWL